MTFKKCGTRVQIQALAPIKVVVQLEPPPKHRGVRPHWRVGRVGGPQPLEPAVLIVENDCLAQDVDGERRAPTEDLTQARLVNRLGLDRAVTEATRNAAADGWNVLPGIHQGQQVDIAVRTIVTARGAAKQAHRAHVIEARESLGGIDHRRVERRSVDHGHDPG